MGGNLDQRQINFKKGKYENWDLETDRLKTIAAPLSLRKKILYSGIFFIPVLNHCTNIRYCAILILKKLIFVVSTVGKQKIY